MLISLRYRIRILNILKDEGFSKTGHNFQQALKIKKGPLALFNH